MLKRDLYAVKELKLQKFASIIFFILFFEFLSYTEAVAQSCYVKKVFFEISQNSLENTCARASFLFSNFIKKRDSGTVVFVFLWILQNF